MRHFATQLHMQVLWIYYDPDQLHYAALLTATAVDKVATSDLQKRILQGLKEDARQSKLRARQVRACMHLPKGMHAPCQQPAHVASEGDTAGEEQDEAAQSGPPLHQGIDADGVVRDLEAYLQGPRAW
jgi:hypothetical protein